MKKHSLITLLLCSCFTSPALAETTEAPKLDSKLAQYREAVKTLGGALIGEMKTALAAGGGLKAIEICHSKAAEIAEKISKEQGFNVGRTSLKIRSDKNAPDAWETEQLQKFEARKQAGEDLAKIETGIVEINGKLRYMKAIPLQDSCLGCHGDKIAPELEKKLQTLYPTDKATGFKLGDIRGAFTITENIAAKK